MCVILAKHEQREEKKKNTDLLDGYLGEAAAGEGLLADLAAQRAEEGLAEHR